LIRLIQNEMTKLFKKKILWVMLALTLVFTVFINYMGFRYQDGGMTDRDIQNTIQWEKESAGWYDDNYFTPSEKTQYKAGIDANVEKYELALKYGADSWQAYVALNHYELYDAIYNLKLYKAGYYDMFDEHAPDYYEAHYQGTYDALIERLDKDDWKSFVKSEIDNFRLNDSYYGELELQVLKWRLDYDIPYGNNYKNTVLEDYKNNTVMKNEYNQMTEKDKEKLNHSDLRWYYSAIAASEEAEFDIKNGTEYSNPTSANNILTNTITNYIMLIIILVVIVGGSIVADEFNKGTIKLLLVRPFSRIKIIASKYIASLITLLIGIIALYIIQFIVGGIIFGFGGYSISTVVFDYSTMSLLNTNIFSVTILNILATLPMIILMLTLAFALGTIFNNAAIAIGVSLLGSFSAELINMFAINYEISWLSYFVTLNWDMKYYLYGGLPLLEGLTPLFSFLVCLVYFLVMIVVTFVTFKKRNIKNI